MSLSRLFIALDASLVSFPDRLVSFLFSPFSVNRFAGTRIEDLQGEILPLCKDQHGCRYLQKKLEEGVPEHRDMIFRETYGHFSDLMTGEPSLSSTCLVRFTLADVGFVFSCRSLRKLPLPEAPRVLVRRAAKRHLRVRRRRSRLHLAEHARNSSCSEDDRLPLDSSTGESALLSSFVARDLR